MGMGTRIRHLEAPAEVGPAVPAVFGAGPGLSQTGSRHSSPSTSARVLSRQAQKWSSMTPPLPANSVRVQPR